MAAPKNRRQPQTLRLGILCGGQIKEERLIDVDGPITLGPGSDSTLSLSTLGDRPPVTLFVGHRGRYTLQRHPTLEGKLSRGGQIEVFRGSDPRGSALGAEGEALRMGDRGKITLGEVSILFQVVPKVLAPGARVGLPFFKRFDRVMASVLGLSFICHLSFVCYVQAMEPPPEPTLDTLARSALIVKHRVVLKDRPPPKEPEEKAPPAPQEAVALMDKRPLKAPKKALSQGEVRDAIRERVKDTFGVIGTLGRDGEGRIPNAVSDLLSTKGGPLKDILKTKSPLTTGKGLGLRSRDDEQETVGRESDGPAIEVAQVDVVKRRTTLPKLEESGFESPEALNAPEQLERALRAYSAGIASCHSKALNKNPTVGGRIVMGLFVSEGGKVQSLQVMEDSTGDESLSRCMSIRMKRWSLPKASAPYELSLPYVFTPPL